MSNSCAGSSISQDGQYPFDDRFRGQMCRIDHDGILRHLKRRDFSVTVLTVSRSKVFLDVLIGDGISPRREFTAPPFDPFTHTRIQKKLEVRIGKHHRAHVPSFGNHPSPFCCVALYEKQPRPNRGHGRQG